MRFSLGVLLLALAMSPAVADPLDAPVPPAAPTIGSEIRRGADAGFDCELHNTLPEDSESFFDCIEGAHTNNRQRMGQGYEAFDAGLYYHARQNMQIVADVTSKSTLDYDHDGISRELDLMDGQLKEAMLALHVSEDDVRRAIHGG